jgi:hypothetical protein
MPFYLIDLDKGEALSKVLTLLEEVYSKSNYTSALLTVGGCSVSPFSSCGEKIEFS